MYIFLALQKHIDIFDKLTRSLCVIYTKRDHLHFLHCFKTDHHPHCPKMYIIYVFRPYSGRMNRLIFLLLFASSDCSLFMDQFPDLCMINYPGEHTVTYSSSDFPGMAEKRNRFGSIIFDWLCSSTYYATFPPCILYLRQYGHLKIHSSHGSAVPSFYLAQKPP